MAGPGYQRIADSQHNRPQQDHAFGTEDLITQPAADGHQAIYQGAEGGEQRNRVGFRHTQLFHQIYRHDPLQAVETETLPQFNGEDQVKRLGLFESVQADALSWFVVCSRHIYLFFYIPY